jgi:hypothetical protein
LEVNEGIVAELIVQFLPCLLLHHGNGVMQGLIVVSFTTSDWDLFERRRIVIIEQTQPRSSQFRTWLLPSIAEYGINCLRSAREAEGGGVGECHWCLGLPTFMTLLHHNSRDQTLGAGNELPHRWQLDGQIEWLSGATLVSIRQQHSSLGHNCAACAVN